MALVRRMTAATAAVTLARLFTEWLCYVLGRLHSSYVLSTRIVLHRIEVINKTLVSHNQVTHYMDFSLLYKLMGKFALYE